MAIPPSSPLVSVILPTRNRADLLPRAIASVLSQTCRNLELIVVDDASTDHTRPTLAAIDDPRLRVIHREDNRGAAAARNAGIAIARGELIAFQDDDDCWLPHKLQTQVDALLGAGAEFGWCLAGFICVQPDRCTYVGGERYFREIDYGHRGTGVGLDFRLIATPGWLVRRGALDRAGLFDERLRSWDDWELGLRLDGVTRALHVDEPLFIQDQVRGGGMTRLDRARTADMRIIMEKHASLWADHKDVLARHYYFIGRGETLYEPAPAGRRELWMSVRLRPFQPKAWIFLVFSYLGPRATHAARAVATWLRGLPRRRA